MEPHLFYRTAYEFDLPKELIAQHPVTPRDSSRLMVINRAEGSIKEIPFHQIAELLGPGDSLVFNDTKVIPARLMGKRPSGGLTEIFLIKALENNIWEALVRPGKKVKEGTVVTFGDTFSCTVKDLLPDGRRLVTFSHEGDFYDVLAEYGKIPLPPYIEREADGAVDKERYQTVYASKPGAVAAPTAGLHFTNELLSKLAAKGIAQQHVTLHVGLGTFRPVEAEDIRHHLMHSERCHLSAETAQLLNSRPKDKLQICVGTTCCRVVETAANDKGIVIAGDYDTNIFIYPGYRFKYVNALLTNFHLPGSTLLMLVSAFGGYDLIREAYAKAIEERFRFFSYGDAMLIL